MSTSQSARAAAVVAGWFAGNAALAGMLAGFGEDPFAVLLYACSTALPALAAVAVLTLAGRNPDPERAFTLGAHAIWTLPAALGLVLVGAATFSAAFLYWVGGLLVFGSAIQLVRGSAAPAGPEVADAAA
jgi:hypothetical protein